MRRFGLVQVDFFPLARTLVPPLRFQRDLSRVRESSPPARVIHNCATGKQETSLGPTPGEDPVTHKYLNAGSGIDDTSRLVSRLRHRQLGIFVTTSYVAEQAYKEIIEDGHPVIIVSGADISQILVSAGHSTAAAAQSWLEATFPCNLEP